MPAVGGMGGMMGGMGGGMMGGMGGTGGQTSRYVISVIPVVEPQDTQGGDADLLEGLKGSNAANQRAKVLHLKQRQDAGQRRYGRWNGGDGRGNVLTICGTKVTATNGIKIAETHYAASAFFNSLRGLFMSG